MGSENTKRIAKNTVYLYLRMVLVMTISLYTSRVILRILGVEDYGIYNLVGGVVLMFSFLNNAMVVATQRFLNYELGCQNNIGVSRVFSMSITVHVGIVICILLLAETIGLWFLNTYLNIPDERMSAAKWIYQFSILAACIQVIRSPYNACIIAYEKMSFYAYVSIIEVVLKLLVVFLLLTVCGDKLVVYSILLVIVSLIITMSYKSYCNKFFCSSHYNVFWDRNLFKRMISFSGWSLFGSVAVVGVNQGTNILLNIFSNVVVNASMGIANQVGTAINQFVSNFQLAFNPQIVKLYAKGELRSLLHMTFLCSKISFYLLLVIALPLFFYMDKVLLIWLGVVPEYLTIFCQLTLLYMLIDTLSSPLYMTIYAGGKIKEYQLLISLIILLVLPISCMLLMMGFPPPIVLWVRIVSSWITLGIRIYLLNKYLSFPQGKFWKTVVGRVLLVALVASVVPYGIWYYRVMIENVVITMVFSAIWVLIVIYYWGLNEKERNRIKYIFKNERY